MKNQEKTNIAKAKVLRLMRFSVLIVITSLLFCCGVLHAGDDSNFVSVDMRYKILLSGKTSKIQLLVLIPGTIENRQRVSNIRYSTRPSRVYDADENRYAEFIFVKPETNFELRITLNAELSRYDLSSALEKKPVTTKSLDQNKYLLAEPYLGKDHPTIRSIAMRMPGTSEIDTIKNIYNFVLRNMEYAGYNEGNIGAVKALELKRGDCTEYADLMVTLCRAKNVAARHIHGYTTEFSVTPKHSWVEVYIKDYGWVPFDPTLGDFPEGSFDRLKPIYIYLSNTRNDEKLNKYQYYAYWYWGDPIKVKDTFTVKQKNHGKL